MNSNPVIIGAGIAGLSAANYLIDHAIQPIIIEADSIGRPKVCGELFAPEAVPFLQQWDIPLLFIHKSNFITSSASLSYIFPNAHASVSRSLCESLLAQRAQESGAHLYINTRVTELIPPSFPGDSYIIKLSDGRILKPKTVIIATGKIPGLLPTKTSQSPEFWGIKAHFSNIIMPNELNLYILRNAYMGVTYINNTTVNICCLTHKSNLNSYTSPADFMLNMLTHYTSLLTQNPAAVQLHDPWLTASIVKFGKKNTPEWPNAYFIGDAAATIQPASGNGLTMGLTAGVMAAHHIVTKEQTNFKKLWDTKYTSRLYYARLLHYFFMRPSALHHAFKIARIFPIITKLFYKKSQK